MQEQTVTVLATRDPNCILVQQQASEIGLFVVFAFLPRQIDALETMLEPLGAGWRIVGDALVISAKDEIDRGRTETAKLTQTLPSLKTVSVPW